MRSEDEIDQMIQLEAAKHGLILWRNNSGAYKDGEGRWIRYGLGNISKKLNKVFKSPDRVGILPVVITPEMVGKTLGIFVAIEVKKEDWTFNPNDEHESAQQNFLTFVASKSGIAGFANSVETFLRVIKKN